MKKLKKIMAICLVCSVFFPSQAFCSSQSYKGRRATVVESNKKMTKFEQGLRSAFPSSYIDSVFLKDEVLAQFSRGELQEKLNDWNELKQVLKASIYNYLLESKCCYDKLWAEIEHYGLFEKKQQMYHYYSHTYLRNNFQQDFLCIYLYMMYRLTGIDLNKDFNLEGFYYRPGCLEFFSNRKAKIDPTIAKLRIFCNKHELNFDNINKNLLEFLEIPARQTLKLSENDAHSFVTEILPFLCEEYIPSFGIDLPSLLQQDRQSFFDICKSQDAADLEYLECIGKICKEEYANRFALIMRSVLKRKRIKSEFLEYGLAPRRLVATSKNELSQLNKRLSEVNAVMQEVLLQTLERYKSRVNKLSIDRALLEIPQLQSPTLLQEIEENMAFIQQNNVYYILEKYEEMENLKRTINEKEEELALAQVSLILDQ